MRLFRRKKSFEGCGFQNRGCICDAHSKHVSCQECRFYHMIDSGYGWCKALPTFVIVGWCRDICGMFRNRKVTL